MVLALNSKSLPPVAAPKDTFVEADLLFHCAIAFRIASFEVWAIFGSLKLYVTCTHPSAGDTALFFSSGATSLLEIQLSAITEIPTARHKSPSRVTPTSFEKCRGLYTYSLLKPGTEVIPNVECEELITGLRFSEFFCGSLNLFEKRAGLLVFVLLDDIDLITERFNH
jgi:hypothetical protein